MFKFIDKIKSKLKPIKKESSIDDYVGIGGEYDIDSLCEYILEEK